MLPASIPINAASSEEAAPCSDGRSIVRDGVTNLLKHVRDDLKFRQKNQGYGRMYFIIGSSRSKGSEIGAGVKVRSRYFIW